MRAHQRTDSSSLIPYVAAQNICTPCVPPSCRTKTTTFQKGNASHSTVMAYYRIKLTFINCIEITVPSGIKRFPHFLPHCHSLPVIPFHFKHFPTAYGIPSPPCVPTSHPCIYTTSSSKLRCSTSNLRAAAHGPDPLHYTHQQYPNTAAGRNARFRVVPPLPLHGSTLTGSPSHPPLQAVSPV